MKKKIDEKSIEIIVENVPISVVHPQSHISMEVLGCLQEWNLQTFLHPGDPSTSLWSSDKPPHSHPTHHQSGTEKKKSKNKKSKKKNKKNKNENKNKNKNKNKDKIKNKNKKLKLKMKKEKKKKNDREKKNNSICHKIK